MTVRLTILSRDPGIVQSGLMTGSGEGGQSKYNVYTGVKLPRIFGSDRSHRSLI